MNIRIIAASALALGVFTSGALAASSDFIIGSGNGLSDAEASYAIGRDLGTVDSAVEVSSQGLAVQGTGIGIGDYIDESNSESNQRSSNR